MKTIKDVCTIVKCDKGFDYRGTIIYMVQLDKEFDKFIGNGGIYVLSKSDAFVTKTYPGTIGDVVGVTQISYDAGEIYNDRVLDRPCIITKIHPLPKPNDLFS